MKFNFYNNAKDNKSEDSKIIGLMKFFDTDQASTPTTDEFFQTKPQTRNSISSKDSG